MTSHRLYQILLVSIFGLASGWSAYDPISAITFLILAGFIVTAPYFFYQFVVSFLGGHMVIGCLFVIGLFIPILNILLLLYMVIAMFQKFWGMLKAMPLILTGVLYAAALLYGPAYLADHWLGPVAFGHELGRAIGFGLIGLAAMGVVVAGARAMSFNVTLALALVVGFTAYSLVAIISFFMPGGVTIDDIGFDNG